MGLSPDDEERFIVRCALASQIHRKLDEEARFKLEERSRELLRSGGLHQGARTDLGSTSVHLNGSSGEANEVVAKLHGEKLSSVKRRQKVFGSEVSTPTLRKAVATGRVATSTGARIVREVEAALPKGDVPESVIKEAKTQVDAKVADVEARPKSKKKIRSTSTPTPKPDEPVIATTSAGVHDEPVVPETPTSVAEEAMPPVDTKAGQAQGCPQDVGAVRAAVRAIQIATGILRANLPNVDLKRLGKLLAEVVEGAEGGGADRLTPPR